MNLTAEQTMTATSQPTPPIASPCAMPLRVEKTAPDAHTLYSGKHVVGTAYMELDGYYVFLPPKSFNGYLGENDLYAIADTMRMLNREWDRACGQDEAIGGVPDYVPPPTMAEAYTTLSDINRHVQALKVPAVEDGVRKMEGLTKSYLYPWLRPVYDSMSALLKAMK